MKKLLFQTNHSLAPTVVRLLMGIVVFAHGAQKLLGWYGGYGFEGTMSFFTDVAELPWIVGFLVIIIEFFGALCIIVGFATRLWSIATFFVMLGVILTSHADHFFMNWFGNQTGEGYEYFLLLLGMSASLVISGGGRFSVDAYGQAIKQEHCVSEAKTTHTTFS